MANLCTNYLTLIGNKSQRDEFIEMITDKDSVYSDKYLSYRSLIPKIKEFSDKEVSNYLIENNSEKKYIGYYSSVIQKNSISFCTNWSPNKTELLYISNFFPKVKFTLKYEESGMGFEGVYIFKNGKVLSDIVLDEIYISPTVKVFETQHKTLESLVKDITSKYEYSPLFINLFDEDYKNVLSLSVEKKKVKK